MRILQAIPRLLIVLALFAIAAPSLYRVLTQSMWTPAAPITDPGRYRELLAGFEQKPVAHFPAAIPPGAATVRMSFEPSFLQAGGHFQLQFTCPPGRLAEIEKEFAPRALTQPDAANAPALPEPTDHVGPSAGQPLSRRFRLYVLHAQPQGGSEFSWNHGTLGGVGLDHVGSNVIYWVEWW